MSMGSFFLFLFKLHFIRIFCNSFIKKMQNVFNPEIPYCGPIPFKFIPGKSVRIEGIVPQSAYRFSINLQCGPTVARDDVAIQFKVCLREGYVTFNSLVNGIWGEEQRNTRLPICPGEQFEIVIICSYNEFKIDVNGQSYSNFTHKIFYNRISHLVIDGEVSISKICYASNLDHNSNHDGLEHDPLVQTRRTSTPPPRPPPRTFSSRATDDSSLPPSYETVMRQSGNPSGLNHNFNPPYPTDSIRGHSSMPLPRPRNSSSPPYPISDPPYPTSSPNNMPLPRRNNSRTPPFPTSARPGFIEETVSMPLTATTTNRTGLPGIVGLMARNTYVTSPRIGENRSSHSAAMPLNAAPPVFRSVPVNRWPQRRVCAVVFAVVFIVAIVFVVSIFLTVNRRTLRGSLVH